MRQRRGEGLGQLGAALAFDGLAQSVGALRRIASALGQRRA